MDRRTWQIIALVASIASLLYLVCSHFGIFRYIKLCSTNPETYLANYTSLEKADKKRTVIVFTVPVDQLEKIDPFLNSLLDQTVRVDDIGITIPYKDVNKIPQRYKKFLSVYGYSADYDDAATLICAVLREPETDTKIIIVDPNVIYANDFIETIVDCSNDKNNVDKIIRGDETSLFRNGLLIKPKFFTDQIALYQKGTGMKAWLEKCAQTSKVCAKCSNNYNRKS